MILPICVYNHPVLRKRAEPIEEVTDEIVSLAENMFETMANANGIGLAANQVGVLRSIVVVDISEMEDGDGTPPLCLLNPTIVASSPDEVEYEEGCLSLPGLRDVVVRPSAVTVEYDDLDMRHHRLDATGLLARVLQHEIDHLNGVLFIDRLPAMRRVMLKNKLKKLERGTVECNYPFVHPLRSKVETT
ncbi:MAG: peptide deformylase [Chlorobi bacterium]|nr:peptide deformylase [Chlorobiota bacterium]